MKRINCNLVLVSTLAFAVLAAANAHALTLTNLARLGTATQSTDPGWGGPAIQAINGNYGDYTLTLNNDNEWWEVDLKSTQAIGHVRVWLVEGPGVTRGDNSNLRIVIYDSTNTASRVALWETNYPGGFDADTTTRDFGYDLSPGVTGRVVRVEHPTGTGGNYLALSEVEVFNQPLVITALTNFAAAANGATATASSARFSGTGLLEPFRAIDGNHNGLVYDGTAYFWGYYEADTTIDTQPWWRVDFADSQTVGGLMLWPLRNASGARFEQLDVTVSDANSNTLYQQVFVVRPTGSRYVINFGTPINNAKFVTIATTAATPDKSLSLPEVEVFPPVTGTPAITIISNLVAKSATQNQSVTFGPVVATVDGGIRPEELSYRWYRNGSPLPNIAGSWFSSYTIPQAALTNDGDLYKVQVAVPGHGVFSAEVQLTVAADTNAPFVVTNFASVSDQFYMNLNFNESLDANTATNPANYSLAGGPTVGAVTLNPNGLSVRIAVLNLLPGDSVALTVSGIKDLAGNTMVTAQFNAPYPSVTINYALAGTATGSSSPYGLPGQAINGVTSGGTFFHSNNGDNEWWEVNLGQVRQIGVVKIYFRNGFNDRDKNIDLIVLDDSTNRTEVTRITVSSNNIPANPTTITIDPSVSGQIVRIEHPVGIAEYLCLAEVQVIPPPQGLVVTPNPLSWTVNEGDRVVLRSGASGQTPISLQWQLNGVNVPAATNAELVINGITAAQAGTYTFTATNAVRNRASTPASVVVNPRPALADSLVARYRFSQDDGTAVIDDAPLNPAKTALHPGTNAAAWVDSVIDTNSISRNGVLQLDGAVNGTSYISIPAHADLNSRVGTIAFWMKGVAGPGNFSAIMFDRRGGTNNVGDVFGFSADDIQNPAVGTLYSQNYSAQITLKGTNRVDDDTWHHIAYVYRYNPIGTLAFYIDGQLEAEKTDGTAGFWPETLDLRFGAARGWWSNLAGSMDDIHIFNRPLNSGEIAQLINVGVPPKLNVNTVNGQVVLSWDDAAYGLQQSTNIANPAAWTTVTPAATSPWTNAVPTGDRFYRLIKP